jgi:hypothetical protein
MKTNVTLESTDRELFGVTIRQGTKPSFLSITDLQLSYEKARWQYGWQQQNIPSLMQGKQFQERLYHLLFERNLIKIEISIFTEMVETEGIVNVLKGLDVWKTTGRGSNKTVMADPYIWVLLAMELNPMIYAKVVIWLTDSLIFDRIEAGSETRPLNGAINGMLNGKASPENYKKIYIAINKKVFGQHIKGGMRNLASSAQLKQIIYIEKFIINAIDNGWLKTEADVIKAVETYH